MFKRQYIPSEIAHVVGRKPGNAVTIGLCDGVIDGARLGLNCGQVRGLRKSVLNLFDLQFLPPMKLGGFLGARIVNVQLLCYPGCRWRVSPDLVCPVLLQGSRPEGAPEPSRRAPGWPRGRSRGLSERVHRTVGMIPVVHERHFHPCEPLDITQ